MLGKAAVAMWWDIAPDAKSEFEDWHSHEHMPERLAIPGFLRGTRWIALSGEPSYFVMYELSRSTTMTTGPYLQRLNNPTPWSQKIMPQHRNMVRSLCRVRASFGGGVALALATVRLSPAARKSKSLSEWLIGDVMPKLPGRKGLTAAHLLQALPMAGSPQTAEQKIRGGDAVADWVLLVGGYDAGAIRTLLEGELAAESLAAHGALPTAVEGIYSPAYSLVSREIQLVDRPGHRLR
jgi:hypothetical protein